MRDQQIKIKMASTSSKIAHVVVDSSAFLKNVQLQTIGENLYTTPEVVQEIKDKATRERLQFLPYELKFKDVPPEAYDAVVEFSKKTGDYASLSLTDMKVVALTYQLTKEIIGVEHLKTTPEKREVVTGQKIENLVGFCIPPDEEDEINSDEGWITPSNLKSNRDTGIVNNASVIIACLTTDFAMQNVLMQIGLHVITTDGLIIKETKTYILRCHACYKTTSIMTKVFCPHCGNKTLKRVAVTVSENGNQVCHISKRPINIRGTIFSLPTPLGGKHSKMPILCEDQRIPQQRQSKLGLQKIDPLSDDYIVGSSPFAFKDVHSRAAHMGVKAPVIKSNRRRRGK